MGHLATGMDSCVSSPGAGNHRRLREPQYGPQRFLEGFLHGPEGCLTGPAVKTGAVVPQVNSPTHRAI
ncbi:hypothetical protein EV648_101768 [Kribbella sp. VKM Ac-2568]|nr:hypothetical protein EV648_101768 [Kribbella sp. VKM Ac-2568]